MSKIQQSSALIALVDFLMTVLIALSVAQASQAQDRTRWPIPTYTIEVRGAEKNDFSVVLEGSYTRPDGKVIEIESHAMALPATFYLNADCSIDLKITTTEKRFRATVFYEHNDIMKWLATVNGIPGTSATFKLKPYEEK